MYRGEGGIASSGDYANALSPFFGPPSKRIDTEPNHSFPHEAWFLPDAYSGRNEYIRETIVHIVINYNSFMTREILPWREQENPNISWDSIRFDKTLVDMEPEQGIPRYVTVERDSHSDYMVRRGLALIVNHGFAATPGGQRDFMYKVATIAGAVQETCDQAGVVALLRSKNEYRGRAVEDMKNASDAYDLFHHELWRWGIIQHTDRGWYHMDAEAQHVMRCENIQPDTWIVPPRMTSFAAMGQLAETEAWRAGEATARANLLRGEDNFATFRGKSVYEIKPYQLDVDGRTVDPLNRSRMIGDFFVVPYYDIRRDGDGPMYPVARRGRTQVYCCDTDRFETFSWDDLRSQSKFDQMKPLADIMEALNHDGQKTSDRQDALAMLLALSIENMMDGKDANSENIKQKLGNPEGKQQVMQKIPHWLRPYAEAGKDSRDPRQLHTDTQKVCDAMTTIRHCMNTNAQPRLSSKSALVEGSAHSEAQARVSSAVDMALQLQFSGKDINKASDAAQTFSNPLVRTGVEAHTAMTAMKSALSAHFMDQIMAMGNTSHQDVASASASDIQATFMKGDDLNGPLTHAIETVIPSACKAANASAGVLRMSAVGALPVPVSQTIETYEVKSAPVGTMQCMGRMLEAGRKKSHTYTQLELATLWHYEQAIDPKKRRAEYSVMRQTITQPRYMLDHVLDELDPDFLESVRVRISLYIAGHTNYIGNGEWYEHETLHKVLKEFEELGDCEVLRDFIRENLKILETNEMCYVYYLRLPYRTWSTSNPHIQISGHRASATNLDDLEVSITSLFPFFSTLTEHSWQLRNAYLTAPTLADYKAAGVASSAGAVGSKAFATWLTGGVADFDESKISMTNWANLVNGITGQPLDKINNQHYNHDLFNTITYVPIGSRATDFDLLDPFGFRANVAYGVNEALRPAPYDLLCFRPFRRYTMGTGILCKKGSELGNTFRGWADFQLTDNIIAKTHIGHFTFWHASVVTNPKCLFLAEDIFCTNYEGGEGSGVLPWSEITNFREDPMGTMHRNNASIICIPVPVGAINPVDKRLQTMNPISVTGVLDPNMRENTGHHGACMVHLGDYAFKGKSSGALDDLRQMWETKRSSMTTNAAELVRFERACPCPPIGPEIDHQIPGQLFSDIIDQIWGFSKMNHEVDYANSNSFETSGRLINTICFHTMQKFQNPSNLRWEVTNLNTGHFGENGIYEGVKKIRCGFLDYFKNMDYAKAMTMGGLNI